MTDKSWETTIRLSPRGARALPLKISPTAAPAQACLPQSSWQKEQLTSLRSRRYPLGWLSHRFCRSQRDQCYGDHNKGSHSEQFAAGDET
jgi:hypothetical protein